MRVSDAAESVQLVVLVLAAPAPVWPWSHLSRAQKYMFKYTNAQKYMFKYTLDTQIHKARVANTNTSHGHNWS